MVINVSNLCNLAYFLVDNQSLILGAARLLGGNMIVMRDAL